MNKQIKVLHDFEEVYYILESTVERIKQALRTSQDNSEAGLCAAKEHGSKCAEELAKAFRKEMAEIQSLLEALESARSLKDEMDSNAKKEN